MIAITSEELARRRAIQRKQEPPVIIKVCKECGLVATTWPKRPSKVCRPCISKKEMAKKKGLTSSL